MFKFKGTVYLRGERLNRRIEDKIEHYYSKKGVIIYYYVINRNYRYIELE